MRVHMTPLTHCYDLKLLDHRFMSIYGIGNGIMCAIVPHSNAPETLPRILSTRKDLVKGHLEDI